MKICDSFVLTVVSNNAVFFSVKYAKYNEKEEGKEWQRNSNGITTELLSC